VRVCCEKLEQSGRLHIVTDVHALRGCCKCVWVWGCVGVCVGGWVGGCGEKLEQSGRLHNDTDVHDMRDCCKCGWVCGCVGVWVCGCVWRETRAE